jgi:hypothetical protein
MQFFLLPNEKKNKPMRLKLFKLLSLLNDTWQFKKRESQNFISSANLLKVNVNLLRILQKSEIIQR